MCDHFTAENADITIGMIGMNVRERLLVQANDEIAARMRFQPAGSNGREKAIARLTSIRQHRRQDALAQASRLLTDMPALLGLVAQCTACGECQDACPFCNTEAFVPHPAQEPHTDRLRTWPGAQTPQHPTRERGMGFMTEMIQWGRRAASCVSCGMCEASCPHHVPLTAIQGVLGRHVQEEFNYVPGRRLDERLPWAKA